MNCYNIKHGLVVNGRDAGARLLQSAIPLNMCVLGWAPGRQAVRQRFPCRRFIGGCCRDQHLCGTEGNRPDGEEKVVYDAAATEALVDPHGALNDSAPERGAYPGGKQLPVAKGNFWGGTHLYHQPTHLQ